MAKKSTDEQPTYYDLVYEIVRQIPEGRVTNYGAIADYLALGSARMVGWALNQCGHAVNGVPAHRVVNRKGELSGRHMFGSETAMQDRLEADGIVVKDHRVVDFDQLLWHPQELDDELSIETPDRKLDT